MNTISKKLMLEIMSFLNSRDFKEDDIYVKKASQRIKSEVLVSRLSELLDWINPRFHFSFTNLDRYDFSEDFMDQETINEIAEEYNLLFKNLPELNEIFILKKLHIEFNPSLTKSDIQELYKFVEDNYVINPKHMTRYIRPSKD